MEAIEDLSMLIADEQQSASEDSSFVHHSSSSASTSSASKPLPSTTSYDGILARYVSRLTEGDDEAFETLGVEGVDPTLDVMEYFDSLKVEVRPCLFIPLISRFCSTLIKFVFVDTVE